MKTFVLNLEPVTFQISSMFMNLTQIYTTKEVFEVYAQAKLEGNVALYDGEFGWSHMDRLRHQIDNLILTYGLSAIDGYIELVYHKKVA